MGQKLFLCRVGRGAIPRPVKVDPPFPHAGPARLAVKSKKSPTEVPLKSIRKPSGACGALVVAFWRLGGGSLRVSQSPIKRLSPAPDGGCRESYPPFTLACASPIGRGVSRRLQVRFSTDTRGESRRRSRRKKSAAVSVLTSSPETPPRFSCPRQVP